MLSQTAKKKSKKLKLLQNMNSNASPSLPFITEGNINYLIKMKGDTVHFCQLLMSKYFNFWEAVSTRSDPFLISASLKQRNFAVGSGISAM